MYAVRRYHFSTAMVMTDSGSIAEQTVVIPVCILIIINLGIMLLLWLLLLLCLLLVGGLLERGRCILDLRLEMSTKVC